MPVPRPPSDKLPGDVGRPQTNETRDSGVHSGEPRAVACDTGGNSLLEVPRLHQCLSAREHLRIAGPARALRTADAASEGAQPSPSGSRPEGRRPDSSSAVLRVPSRKATGCKGAAGCRDSGSSRLWCRSALAWRSRIPARAHRSSCRQESVLLSRHCSASEYQRDAEDCSRRETKSKATATHDDEKYGLSGLSRHPATAETMATDALKKSPSRRVRAGLQCVATSRPASDQDRRARWIEDHPRAC
jgi:hypothetical protein